MGSSKEPSVLRMLSQGQPLTTEKDKNKSREAEIAYRPFANSCFGNSELQTEPYGATHLFD